MNNLHKVDSYTFMHNKTRYYTLYNNQRWLLYRFDNDNLIFIDFIQAKKENIDKVYEMFKILLD